MATPCLSRQDLESLLDDQLPEPRRTTAAAHLAICPECQSAAEAIIAALAARAVPAGALSAAPLPVPDGEELGTLLQRLKALGPDDSEDSHLGATVLDTPLFTPGFAADTEPDALNVGGSLRDPDPDAPHAHIPQQSRSRSDRTTLDDPALGTSIGPYTLTAELGHGGFGIVYKAEQQRPIRRTVALKLIKLGMDSREIIARFDAERQALALMDHPNIARILDAGTTGEGQGSRDEGQEAGAEGQPSLDPHPLTLDPCSGRPYFVMELVDGLPLTDYCDAHRLSIKRRLELFITVCQAVQHAHQKGIIHRDLKPSNVMVTERDGQPVVKVIDFGIAKALGASLGDGTAVTAAAQMIGTPLYMSPEQVGLGTLDVDTRSDVYSLGVLLYELLTGTTPFERERMERSSSWEVQRIIRDEEAPRPSARLNALSRSGLPSRTAGPKDIPSPTAPTRDTGPTTLADVAQRRETTARVLQRNVRGEIDSIALKALQKQPSERYATAQDLADDLQRFLHGEPIRAKPPGTVAIVSKWVRRRPALASLIAVSVLAVAGVAIEQPLHAVALKELNDDLRKSNTELSQSLLDEQAATTRAEQNERESREVVYASDIHNAWRARAEGDFVEFESIIQKYGDDGPLAQYRGLEWHFLDRLTRTEGRELLRLPQAVYAATFSPNGRWLAVAGQDGMIREIEYSTGRLAEQWNSGQTEINAVQYSPGADSLWSSGDDGTLREWRVDTHAALQAHAAHAEGAYDIVYYCPPQPEDWRMVSCGREPVIRLWGPNGEPREILEGHTDWVEDLELHPDGRRLVSVSQDGTARVWDLDEKRLLRILSPQSGKVRHAAISPDGRILATCSDRVRLWDLDNWDRLSTQDLVDTPHRACFAFPDAQLCVADNVGMLHLFHLQLDDTGALIGLEPGLSWRGHAGRPYVLTRSPSGGELISAGQDGRVVVWSTSGLASTETRSFDCPGVSACAFDPERGRLICAGRSGVHGYDCESPSIQPIRFPSDENQHWHSVAVSPAGDLLAAGTHLRDHVQTWRLSDHSQLVTIDLLDGAERDEYTGVVTLSFSQDGTTLAALAERTLFLLDPRTGQVQQQINMGQGNTAMFSPADPDVLVLRSPTHTFRALHWRSGEVLWETPELAQPPTCVVFTPDGQQILSSGQERTVRVWDAHTGSLVRELRGHRAFVEYIDVSPDGRTIASIDRDHVLKFWHRMTGQFLYEMTPPPRDADGRFCVFSPDGRWLAVPSSPDTVQLLPLKQ